MRPLNGLRLSKIIHHLPTFIPANLYPLRQQIGEMEMAGRDCQAGFKAVFQVKQKENSRIFYMVYFRVLTKKRKNRRENNLPDGFETVSKYF